MAAKVSEGFSVLETQSWFKIFYNIRSLFMSIIGFLGDLDEGGEHA